jgi:NitT/TauT family transport system permease protein
MSGAAIVATSAKSKLVRRALDSLMLLGALLLVWQGVYEMVGAAAIASPEKTFAEAYKLVTGTDFWPNVASTLRASAIAMVLAIGGGLLIGLGLGSHRTIGDAGEPALMAFYTVPKVAFFPIILLFFGIGLAAEVVFGAIHGVVPVAIFTLNAVRNIKPVLLKTAHVMGLSRLQTWWTISLPSAVPEVFTGIRIGVSLTFIGTILSEMFGSHEGIGFMLMNAIGINNGELTMALAVLIMLFAVAVSVALLVLDNWLHRRI